MKKNKVAVIVIISIIALISLIAAGAMFYKFAYKNKDNLNIPKKIKTETNNKNITSGKKAQQEAKEKVDRQQKLENFANKYKDNNSFDKSLINSTPERNTKNGEFYIDNTSGDFYSKNITDLDDSNRIEDRLKEAASDMKNVYSETISFSDNADKLNSYLSKRDNKSRFSYLYGINSASDLKSFVSRLSFLKNSKVKYGILENIKKVDDNNITFEFKVKADNGTSQTFNVSVNFADKRAILNIRIS